MICWATVEIFPAHAQLNIWPKSLKDPMQIPEFPFLCTSLLFGVLPHKFQCHNGPKLWSLPPQFKNTILSSWTPPSCTAGHKVPSGQRNCSTYLMRSLSLRNLNPIMTLVQCLRTVASICYSMTIHICCIYVLFIYIYVYSPICNIIYIYVKSSFIVVFNKKDNLVPITPSRSDVEVLSCPPLTVTECC